MAPQNPQNSQYEQSPQHPQRTGLKVQVWIHRAHPATRNLEVLLLKLTPERGEFWQPVTGGVEPGESPDQAALREAQEETGLRYVRKPIPLQYRFRFFSPRFQKEFEEHVFSLEAPPAPASDDDLRLDPREHTEYQWLPADQALTQLKHPSNAEGLRRLMAAHNARQI